MNIAENTSPVNTGVTENITFDSLQSFYEPLMRARLREYQKKFGAAFAFGDANINSPDGLSVLRSTTISVGKTRTIEKPNFIQDRLANNDAPKTAANAKWFNVLPVVAPDHKTLACLLRTVSADDRCLIVRAAMIDGSGIFGTHRCGWHASARTDGGASVGPFVPRLGHWLPCDLDGVELPDGIGLDAVPGMLSWLSSTLPEPFKDAAFVYQLSSSATDASKRRIGLHLYFRAAEPLDCRQWHAVSTMIAKSWVGPGRWDPSFAVGTHKQFVAATYVDRAGNVVPDPLSSVRIGVYGGDRAAMDLGGLLEAVARRQAMIVGSREIARQRAAHNAACRSGDVAAMVARYERRWRDYVDRWVGDGNNPDGKVRVGYDKAMYRMTAIAIEEGETDRERLCDLLAATILDAAEARGELNRPGKKPAEYVADLARVFDNVQRDLLGVEH